MRSYSFLGLCIILLENGQIGLHLHQRRQYWRNNAHIQAAIIKTEKYEVFLLPVENFDISKSITVSFRPVASGSLTPVTRLPSSYSVSPATVDNNNNNLTTNPTFSPPRTTKEEPKNKANHAIHVARQIHPSFLKSNAQQHAEWIFGAFAELIDNAVDAKAKNLTIDYDPARKSILFADDGIGMTRKELKRMLSFGHKQEKK